MFNVHSEFHFTAHLLDSISAIPALIQVPLSAIASPLSNLFILRTECAILRSRSRSPLDTDLISVLRPQGWLTSWAPKS
jgi:hypothetical protein